MEDTACDIVGLGVIAVDDMLYVDSYPPADAKIPVNSYRRQGGGNTSCALVAASKLGSRCSGLGRLGDDDLSAFVDANLPALGVDLSHVLREPEAGPLHCTIVVSADTGSRSIYLNFSKVKPLQSDELSPEWFAGAKVLLIDHMHQPAVLAAARMAQEAGLQVVSDIEMELPDLDDVRRHIDHYICSAEFALPFTGCDTPERACEAMAKSGGHRTVVVTAGAQGCYWRSQNTADVQHLPAHDIKPVDTTGCGDVFHGAFCHGLANGWPIDRIIPFANAAAAIKATRTGGWAAVPHPDEIEQLLG